ncbi:DDE_3 domain-containing protein [Trichonephila clavipes]|nr:DDE_3 domain-containing protein [Trichonephila clavipes]
MNPCLAFCLILAGLSSGESQEPVTTKKTSLSDTVLEVQEYSFGGGELLRIPELDMRVQIGTMKGQTYLDVILKQDARLSRGAMGEELVFMFDNTRPHHENIVHECFQPEDITRPPPKHSHRT